MRKFSGVRLESLNLGGIIHGVHIYIGLHGLYPLRTDSIT